MSVKEILAALDEVDAQRRLVGLPYATEKARAELAALQGYFSAHRETVLSEVRERLAKHADDLRRQGDDDSAEIVNDLHDWTYEWERK